jgi:hypothetical protein
VKYCAFLAVKAKGASAIFDFKFTYFKTKECRNSACGTTRMHFVTTENYTLKSTNYDVLGKIKF